MVSSGLEVEEEGGFDVVLLREAGSAEMARGVLLGSGVSSKSTASVDWTQAAGDFDGRQVIYL